MIKLATYDGRKGSKTFGEVNEFTIGVHSPKLVVVPAEVLAALALWVLHTHAFDAASMTPYLHVTSPERSNHQLWRRKVLVGTFILA